MSKNRVPISPDEWTNEIPRNPAGVKALVPERIHCTKCGQPVSSPVPKDTVVRAWVECPECIEKQPEVPLNQRLFDLVRYQRSEIHNAGLITDEEYFELAKEHPAVARLEDYDRFRRRETELVETLQEAYERLQTVGWYRQGEDPYHDELPTKIERVLHPERIND